MKTVFLSRPYQVGMALYGGRNSFQVERSGDISRGDTANSLKITFSNHAGTHLDFPAHVHPAGRTIDDYAADYFIFRQPFVIKTKPSHGCYLNASDLQSQSPPKNADLILIKTGTPYDSDDYWQNNPGLSPSAAKYIKSLAPRCVGMDFISVNAWSDRESGRKSHRILLAEPEVLILEDLDLNPLDDPKYRLTKVTVAPLRLAGADGTPAVVLAELMPIPIHEE